MKTKTEIISLLVMVNLLYVFSSVLLAADYQIPAAVSTVHGSDYSIWEQVCAPGFGNDDNMAVVALAEYQGRLYAMTRNDVLGVSIWRTAGDTWEQVAFPGGITNGIYGNSWNNSHMGAMIVFKDKLYCGFSSGIQGSFLKSTGCEIWRYDGTTWEPVISDKKDREESGTITAITGCKDNDGELTAQIIDVKKAWVKNQWAGGVLQITSGSGKFRRFDIISNTENTLTVQQNEIAVERGTEYTVCDSKHYVNPFPPHEYDLGTVQVNDSYEIGTGYDENGFGDYWNKVLPKMTIFDNKLYASTALNYENGGQAWYTEDGDNWVVTQPSRSLGLFHTDPNYIDSKKPVTRGIPALGACSVSGSEVLYAGTLGSEGNLGSCARFAKLTDKGWELMVDTSVDDNDTGTNENGFGIGLNCTMYNGNFNVWSIVCFNNELYVGFQSLGGTRVLYSPSGSSEDGSWFYSVGGDSGIPNGFDGVIIPASPGIGAEKIYKNIAINLFSFGDYLYAGLIVVPPTMAGLTNDYLTGSQIWKTRDGRKWEQVTGDGFGDNYVLTFEGFTVFNGQLYVAGSRASNTVGIGLGGAKIYRQVPAAQMTISNASILYNLSIEHKDKIIISGSFTAETAIDLLSEDMMVTVDSATEGVLFSDTIPAGCMSAGTGGDQWFYNRALSGCETKIDTAVIDFAKSTFRIIARDEDVSHLSERSGDTEEIRTVVQIGNDCGTAKNTFTVKKDRRTGVPKRLVCTGT